MGGGGRKLFPPTVKIPMILGPESMVFETLNQLSGTARRELSGTARRELSGTARRQLSGTARRQLS